MEDQAHAHRLERRPGELRPVLGGRRRQLQPFDMAEIAAAALQQSTLFDQLGAAVALQPFTGRTHPGIGDERLAVGLLHRLDDALLQAQQVAANRGRVEAGHHRGLMARWPMSRRYCAPSRWMPDNTW